MILKHSTNQLMRLRKLWEAKERITGKESEETVPSAHTGREQIYSQTATRGKLIIRAALGRLHRKVLLKYEEQLSPTTEH